MKYVLIMTLLSSYEICFYKPAFLELLYVGMGIEPPSPYEIKSKYLEMEYKCDTPIPGVPLTTRQPTKTCEYRVLRYPTHMSHILRPISIYFSYKYPISYDILQEFDVQIFYTFTYQNILKLDCSNIFYKNASQGHNPTFFVPMASKERRLLVYLKGGSHDGVSKAQ